MKILKLTLFILICSFSVKGQNYLNIGPINAGTNTGRISTSGQTAELSISNRAVSSFVNNPTLGERWVIYNNGTSTDGKLRFWTNGDKVTFTKEGRVGIGTSYPSKLLDVNGDAKIGNTTERHYLKISSSVSPEVRFQTPSGDETIRLGMAQAASSYYLFDDQDFYVWTAQTNSTPLLVKQNGNVILNAKMGNVGIGTTTPGGMLDIKAGAAYPIRTSTTQRYVIEVKNSNDAQGGWWLANHDNGDFAIHENQAGDRLTVQDGGNVGIGTSSPDAKLTVKGDIHAERVKVDLNIPAPDYVFEEDYDLRSLDETANYITENKHLPEVPSAKELETNGIDLVEMNMLLLKKVEELTLHMIEMKKEISTLKSNK